MALQSLKNLIAKIKNGHRVYLFGDNPLDDRFSPLKMIGGDRLHVTLHLIDSEKSLGTQSVGNKFFVDKNQVLLNNSLREVADSLMVDFIDQIDNVCPDYLCTPLVEYGPLYKDDNHMRPYLVNKFKLFDSIELSLGL